MKHDDIESLFSQVVVYRDHSFDPIPPFRLNLTEWALRRRSDNMIKSPRTDFHWILEEVLCKSWNWRINDFPADD